MFLKKTVSMDIPELIHSAWNDSKARNILQMVGIQSIKSALNQVIFHNYLVNVLVNGIAISSD